MLTCHSGSLAVPAPVRGGQAAVQALGDGWDYAEGPLKALFDIYDRCRNMKMLMQDATCVVVEFGFITEVARESGPVKGRRS